MCNQIGLRTTHPIGCRANFPIHAVRLAIKSFKHLVLPVNFLPRCNSKRLESSDRIAKLIKVIIDFIFLLIIRGSGFELIPAPLLFALNLIAASALATSVVVLRWSIPIEAAKARCCSFSDALMHFAALGLKAFLVSRPNLAEVARGIGLGPCLRLGKTAERGQGRTKESLLSDALEAVIAAVHLDGGDAATRALVDRLFASQIERLDRVEVEGKDFKTSLQEILQAKGRPTPRYRIQATEGPPHRPLFHVDLLVEGELLARGSGGSKKEAEQRAARQALRSLASKRSGS